MDGGELWDLVFTSWDTSMVVMPPVPAAKRHAAQTAMYVGTLTEDASVSTASNARAKKSHAVPKADNDLTFPFVDVKGSTFQSSIRYDMAENMTIDHAKGHLTTQWDMAELCRLAKANTSLMVYWCRNALLKDLRSAGHPGVATDEYYPDLSELVHIELCRDVWRAKLRSTMVSMEVYERSACEGEVA
ncbi:hypothetical protein CABS01_05383 [Colletotrichum abscissum]|nr:uncharacterized protein CABS01_05383 [Colletotrichum abscissum]KAK1520878.1 hypothetical protein CABS01_05383 [Colletotrichum abscissum]